MVAGACILIMAVHDTILCNFRGHFAYPPACLFTIVALVYLFKIAFHSIPPQPQAASLTIPRVRHRDKPLPANQCTFTSPPPISAVARTHPDIVLHSRVTPAHIVSSPLSLSCQQRIRIHARTCTSFLVRALPPVERSAIASETVSGQPRRCSPRWGREISSALLGVAGDPERVRSQNSLGRIGGELAAATGQPVRIQAPGIPLKRGQHRDYIRSASFHEARGTDITQNTSPRRATAKTHYIIHQRALTLIVSRRDRCVVAAATSC
ncbi:hypothetical protein EDC01DRAFT_175081 [Geopyxis carbonaria]|nr:hypothetical protein EDC01DRAFT_175081 [Geopyxis carbonaria]